jgi:HTH-like domain
VIDKLAAQYPVQVMCEVLDLPRSSYYYLPHPRDGTALKAALQRVGEEWPTYGYRRLTIQVCREDKLVVNTKRVRRLAKLMHSGQKHKRKKRRTTNSQHPFPRYPNLVQDLEIVRPDQVWVVEEEVDLSDYLDFADAFHQIGRFLEDVYMHKRIHSSLGYLTPAEFENQWSAQQTAGSTID